MVKYRYNFKNMKFTEKDLQFICPIFAAFDAYFWLSNEGVPIIITPFSFNESVIFFRYLFSLFLWICSITSNK
jgi:hypothetical protein